jgi:hypothetical protein
LLNQGHGVIFSLLCTVSAEVAFGSVMKAWIFYPPLKVMSGGCMVLLQIARQLLAMGRLGGVLYWENPAEGLEAEGLPWMRAGKAPMRRGDVYLVPEGWPNALVFGFRAGCRTVVYCQNWSYLFHGLEEGVHWRDLPVDFLAVSDPVAWHMEQVLGKRPGIIRPAIDTELFFAPESKPDGPRRIAFMPRKNKALADQIRRIFEERNPGAAVEWVPVHGLNRQDVANVLRSCHVFLATGFPEGCPLPPLEAMACGCLCAGFAGFGGWDYMRQADAGGFAPQGYALREVPWEGNGWWVADGDVLGAATGLERALAVLADGSAGSIRKNARRTAQSYDAAGQSAGLEGV